MNSFQSQVLHTGLTERTLEESHPAEFMLSAEQLKSFQAILPPAISFTPVNKKSRQLTKRPSQTASRADLEVAPNEKRSAYIKAINTISNLADPNSRCLELLNVLQKHPKANPFLKPVDPIALGIPDYPTIIKEPMDLSTIAKNLDAGLYKQFEEFDADVQKMFTNALTFNKPGQPVYKMAEEMRNYYQKLCQEKPGTIGISKKVSKPPRSIEGSRQKQKLPTSVKPLSLPEQQTLADLIKNKLPSEYLHDVWQIVAQGQNQDQDDLDIDISQLSPQVARKLEQFVNSKIASISKRKKAKADEAKAALKIDTEPAPLANNQPASNAAPTKYSEAKKYYDQNSGSSYLSNSDSDSSI